jgi:hypothetical protein
MFYFALPLLVEYLVLRISYVTDADLICNVSILILLQAFLGQICGCPWSYNVLINSCGVGASIQPIIREMGITTH